MDRDHLGIAGRSERSPADCVLVAPPATTLASGARDLTIASMGPRGTSGRTTTTILAKTPDASADASDHANTG